MHLFTHPGYATETRSISSLSNHDRTSTDPWQQLRCFWYDIENCGCDRTLGHWDYNAAAGICSVWLFSQSMFFKWSNVWCLEVHAIDCDLQCCPVFRFHGVVSWNYDIQRITKEEANSHCNTSYLTRMSCHKRRYSMVGMGSGYVNRTILSINWIYSIAATIYEAILFGFALFKYMQKSPKRVPGIELVNTLINDNILYFFG